MTERERAIAAIEECRGIHEHWLLWQESDPNWRSQTGPESAGGPEWHRRWIVEYDRVLKVLRE